LEFQPLAFCADVVSFARLRQGGQPSGPFQQGQQAIIEVVVKGAGDAFALCNLSHGIVKALQGNRPGMRIALAPVPLGYCGFEFRFHWWKLLWLVSTWFG
jgi:hypothetical protein